MRLMPKIKYNHLNVIIITVTTTTTTTIIIIINYIKLLMGLL